MPQHTTGSYASTTQMAGQDKADADAIIAQLGHFLYRSDYSLFNNTPGRTYRAVNGKKVICEGQGAATKCRWA